MNPGSFYTIVEMFRDQTLSVAVHIEVYGSSRYNSNSGGSKPLEECPPTLIFVHRTEDLEGVVKVI
jgi:hypothetical protein